MTISITVVCPRFLVAAVDRRLVSTGRRRILAEQSTKLTSLRCADAVMLITYAGIGEFRGQTPTEWISALASRANLKALCFREVLDALAVDAGERLSHVPHGVDRRHTFVVGAFAKGSPSICLVSNFETLTANGDIARSGGQVNDRFVVSAVPERTNSWTVPIGAAEQLDDADMRRIKRAANTPDAAGTDVKNLCVTAIWNAAERARAKLIVGNSVLWAVIDQARQGIASGVDDRGGYFTPHSRTVPS